MKDPNEPTRIEKIASEVYGCSDIDQNDIKEQVIEIVESEIKACAKIARELADKYYDGHYDAELRHTRNEVGIKISKEILDRLK